MFKFLRLITIYALSIIPYAVIANPTDDLFDAIKHHNVDAANQAISRGANINAHGTTSTADLAATDWTPLMKSIAHLNSSIIKSQSYINTVAGLARYLFLGSTYLALYITSPIVKSYDEETIDNQFKITQLLLNHPNIDKTYIGRNNISAPSIAHHGFNLLQSPDICPPAPALTPDKKYHQMLQTIVSQLASPNMPAIPGTIATSHAKTAHFKKINIHEKLPIIFDANYDISFGGLERLHPFDAKKYGKVSRYLLNAFSLTPDQFYKPESASEKDLLLVHTPQYLETLKNSFTLGKIADMPFLGLLPNALAQKALLDPVKLATGGTILGADLALEYGWAINLSGGYHHAKRAEPVVGGFCIINDICIAARKVLIKHPDYRILIVDLDAHQGNGHEDVAETEKQIAIFDVYNGQTWPGDFACQERINYNFPVDGRKTDDKAYLTLLAKELPKAIDTVKPDLIIYNAGTDVYYEDPIGCMALTKQGIINRDEMVFTHALTRNIPILMVLSGGYHAQSYAIISASVENIWKKLLTDTFA